MIQIANDFKRYGFNPYPASKKKKCGLSFLDGTQTFQKKADNPNIVTHGSFKDRIISSEEIGKYFASDCNICHVFTDLFEYNIICLDYDVKKSDKIDQIAVEELNEYITEKETALEGFPVVLTPTGGIHIYCKIKNGILTRRTKFNVKDRAIGGDLLAAGSLVILPPSTYHNGCYELASGSFENIPQFESLQALLNHFSIEIPYTNDDEARLDKRGSAESMPPDLMEHIQTELEKIKSAEKGSRNNTINSSVFVITKIAISYMKDQAILDMVYPYIKDKAENDKEYKEFIATAKNALKAGKQNSETGEQNKNKYPRIDEIKDFLSSRYLFRYNEVLDIIEWRLSYGTEWNNMTDIDQNRILASISRKFGKFNEKQARWLLEGELLDVYNPFKEFFANLQPWDGETDYIRLLSNTVTVEVGQEDMWHLFFRRWLMSMVRQALQISPTGNKTIPSQNCLVLHGKQGYGKSTWLLNLVMVDGPKYRFSGFFDTRNKDCMMHLSRTSLVNLDEIENTTTKNDWAALKSLLTSSEQNMRMPYRRNNQIYPRRCSFSGNINSEAFLSDLTGSRRFLIVTVSSITHPSRDLIEKAFAHAYALLLRGEKYWFDQAENIIIDKHNERYTKTSVEEDLLNLYCENPEDENDPDGVWLPALAIVNALSMYAGSSKLDKNRMAIVLGKRDYRNDRRQINGERRNRWFIKFNDLYKKGWGGKEVQPITEDASRDTNYVKAN